jgi:hypothetical protein
MIMRLFSIILLLMLTTSALAIQPGDAHTHPNNGRGHENHQGNGWGHHPDLKPSKTPPGQKPPVVNPPVGQPPLGQPPVGQIPVGEQAAPLATNNYFGFDTPNYGGYGYWYGDVWRPIYQATPWSPPLAPVQPSPNFEQTRPNAETYKVPPISFYYGGIEFIIVD